MIHPKTSLIVKSDGDMLAGHHFLMLVYFNDGVAHFEGLLTQSQGPSIGPMRWSSQYVQAL